MNCAVLYRTEMKHQPCDFDPMAVDQADYWTRHILSEGSFNCILNHSRSQVAKAIVLDSISQITDSTEQICSFLLQYSFLPDKMMDPSTLTDHLVKSWTADGIVE